MSGPLSDVVMGLAIVLMIFGGCGALALVIGLAAAALHALTRWLFQRQPTPPSFVVEPLRPTPPSGPLCAYCLQPIADDAAIWSGPDGTVMHLRCRLEELRKRRATIRDDGIIGGRA